MQWSSFQVNRFQTSSDAETSPSFTSMRLGMDIGRQWPSNYKLSGPNSINSYRLATSTATLSNSTPAKSALGTFQVSRTTGGPNFTGLSSA